jgi:hypothetical protein
LISLKFCSNLMSIQLFPSRRVAVRVLRFLAWFIVVDALTTMFGVMTAPLLLILTVDTIVGILIIRDCVALCGVRHRAVTDAGILACVPASSVGGSRRLQQILPDYVLLRGAELSSC